MKSAIIIDIEKPKKKSSHQDEATKLLQDNPDYLTEMDEKFKMAAEHAAETGVDPLDPSTIPKEGDEENGGSENSTTHQQQSYAPVDPSAAVKNVMTGGMGASMHNIDNSTSKSEQKPSLETFVTTSKSEEKTTKLPPGIELPTLPTHQG
jgi:hypothetical protein